MKKYKYPEYLHLKLPLVIKDVQKLYAETRDYRAAKALAWLRRYYQYLKQQQGQAKLAREERKLVRTDRSALITKLWQEHSKVTERNRTSVIVRKLGGRGITMTYHGVRKVLRDLGLVSKRPSKKA